MNEVDDAKQIDGSAIESVRTLAAAIRAAADLMVATEKPQPEALNASNAAALLGISRTTFYALHERGEVPAPVNLRDPRWPKRELIAWLLSGAPPRAKWVAMKDAALRNLRI